MSRFTRELLSGTPLNSAFVASPAEEALQGKDDHKMENASGLLTKRR